MSATPANGRTPPATRRSDLPPPFGLQAISEDLTESQRALMAITAREQQRDRQMELALAKLDVLIRLAKWGGGILAGAVLLAIGTGIVGLMLRGAAVVPRIIGGSP